MNKINILKTSEQLKGTIPLFKQLVPTLNEGIFLEQVQRKQKQGYTVISLQNENEELVSIAGIRFYEYFGCGNILIIDDFITAKQHQQQGYGTTLFNWIENYAKEHNCTRIELESSHIRTTAHKFYIKRGMKDSAAVFSKELK
jgi:GNAT superfamily N-acetyltransferase